MAESTSYQENVLWHDKNADNIKIQSLAKQVENLEINEKDEKEVDEDKDVDDDKDIDDVDKDVDENVTSRFSMKKNDEKEKERDDDEYEENLITHFGVKKTGDLEQDQYCKTHGMCVTWNTEVNLGDPIILGRGYRSDSVDEAVLDFYNSLQYTFYETGFPETEDRTAMPRRTINKENAVVAVLSAPCELMAPLIECGNQVSDSMHLIFSESWVLKKPSLESPGLYELFILKAITFHKGGVTYIDEFNPPRKCTYLINFFTNAATSGLTDWGTELEKNLDIPMSSSVPLCAVVDDKLWTRYQMSRCGVPHPESLAFTLAPKRFVPSSETIKVCTLGRCVKSGNPQEENIQKQNTFDNKEENSNVPNTLNAPIESHPVDLMTNCVFTAKQIVDGGGVCTHAVPMEEEIRNFLKKPSILNRKIVVKPSGPDYHASIGVTFHAPGNVDSVIDAVEDLLDSIDDGDSILVETFVEPINPRPVTGVAHNIQQWKADGGLSFRVRSTCCKDFDGKPVCTIITCGVASKHVPVNGDNTVVQTLDTTLLAFGVSDPTVRRNIERDVRKKSEDLLQTIMEEEKKLTVEQRGGIGGCTEIIGIDFFLTEKNGQISPVAIEVNSHDCTINCQIFEFIASLAHRCTVLNGQVMNPVYQLSEHRFGEYYTRENTRVCSDNSNQYERRDLDMPKFDELLGRCVRPWVRTMLTRSQDYVLRNKMILVIGAGGYSKKFIWPASLEMGVKIVLVESNPEHFARDQVHRFICIDIEDHKQDRLHASIIVEILRDENISVEGCLTFWEDCGPLAALVSELLQLKGNTYKAASIAKTKSRTQAHLRGRNADIPHWPVTNMFASRSARITCEADIEKAIQCVSFPAILKLEYASSAVGVNMVKCEEDIQNQHAYLINTLRTNDDYHGIGLGFSNSMILMDYLQGSEHDIDVVIFERKLIAAFVTDNGLTNWPSYTETSSLMPSSLPVDKQAQLVTAAYQCCTEIGLSNGVFNVEMKMTQTGPKLIEINARMGGFYIRDWVKRLYGIDMMKCALMCSCGIRPYVPTIPPTEFIMGVMLIPSEHKHVMLDNVTRMVLDDMQSRGEVILTMLESEEELKHPYDKTEYEEPYANVAVRAHTVEEARRKLLAVCKKLSIETSDYKVSEFIKFF
ncbi:carnosine synthase 1-like isoform X2 [Dreissena polymorpha]|uniref:carnosine synthase 1-like isoform X2 n=1 Tax=Dreissena polymorpha TaxID=45954 RepID=UPI0022640617|nr:carnosine synthase 1-like isoform X2 [Dreissena polymorpha]